MINQTLVTACVVIALACFCNCDDPPSSSPEDDKEVSSLDPVLVGCKVEDESTDRPLITCVVDGVTVKANVYEKKELSPEILEKDVQMIKKINKHVKDVSKSFLLNEGSRSNSVLHMGFSFKKMLTNLKVQGRYNEFNPDYCDGMYYFVRNITGSTSEIELSKDEAHKRIQILMDAIVNLVSSTNNGIYLDYMEMTFDGMSALDYMAPVVQTYRDNGFDTPINLCNTIADGFKAINTFKDRIKNKIRPRPATPAGSDGQVN